MAIIVIKTSQSNNAPSALANGEFAYSYSSNKLFIGQTDDANAAVSVEYIGGKLLVDKVANLEAAVAASGTDKSFANLVVTGVLSFGTYSNNALLYTDRNGVVNFASGSAGKVMQVAANGVPSFDDLNGGSF